MFHVFTAIYLSQNLKGKNSFRDDAIISFVYKYATSFIDYFPEN
jgi:hypothetical protein